MTGGKVLAEWKKLRPYFSLLDFGARPTTKVAWYVRVGVTALAFVALYRRVDTTVEPLLHAKPPIPIPSEEIEDWRFRFPERIRREIFDEMAVAELAERKRAIDKNTWEGHLWSREDDRGHYERVELRTLAAKYHASLTQMYLILDEGIRERWPGSDGKPLPATTPPLNPRSTW